jgi:hypothetical protein
MKSNKNYATWSRKEGTMSIGAIFIGLALLIITIPVVAGPVVNKRRERFSLVDKPEEPEALEQYQQALLKLRELDFDHQLEVVGDEDYVVLRVDLLAQAAQARETAALPHEDDLEARIEAAVRARRPHRVESVAESQSCYHCGVEMAAADKFCSECGTPAANNCPRCGQQAHPNDKFCVSCGQTLAVGVVG